MDAGGEAQIPGHRRSVSAELIGQETTYSSSEEEQFDPSLYFSREGLGRRSMSEKRHAMEAAQQFAFYQEWSAKRQQSKLEGEGQEDVDALRSGLHTLPSASRMRALQRQSSREEQQQQQQRHRQTAVVRPSRPRTKAPAERTHPLASSEQLLQRCQRLMGHRHPSTDSLGSQPLRASLPAVSVSASHKKISRPIPPRPTKPPPPRPDQQEAARAQQNGHPVLGVSTSLRNGPLKAVGPLQSVESESAFSADSASLLSTASTTVLHHRHGRQRRSRPISFRRAVDPSLREPDDDPAPTTVTAAGSVVTLRPSRGRTREEQVSSPSSNDTKRSQPFWRALWLKRKSRRESSPSPGDHHQQQQQPAPPSAVEARVLAWQRSNDAAMMAPGRSRRESLPSASSEVATEPGARLPNNRAFSVYIPATAGEYEGMVGSARRNSLCYGDDDGEDEVMYPTSIDGRVAVTSR